MAFNTSGASSSSSSSSSSSMSSSQCWWIYDAFISFRGEDTRKNFTDHLCAALDQKGVFTFRDDRNLQRGKAISPELLKAIEGSRFAVIVLSKNYGCSSWCLDELSKIVECMDVMGQKVVPIFYDVSPTEVRKQTGSFEKAFVEHEIAYGTERVQKWRAALTKVANLSGWDLQDKHEATFIQEIVEEIAGKLSPSLPSVTKDLVGIGSRLHEIDTCLRMGVDDVRFIGICGMGGIGKTTIAKVIYHRLSYQFEGSCFLANVREESGKFGYAALQQNLLSQILVQNVNIWDVHRGIDFCQKSMQKRKVLIILDDVDNVQQLELLAGEHGWFGPGSRIIITTRDEHLLIAHGVDAVYKPEHLNGDESLQLLCWKAFKQNNPIEDYAVLSKQIVIYASGIPLALVVLGSFLCGRDVNQWKSALTRLKEIPNREIIDVLRISYDGLEEMEQNIFLDIACFFTQDPIDEVTEILHACGFYPEIGISVLVEKSLVLIDHNRRSEVHSLLREMAVAIVRQESPKEPGRRHRLWLLNDICHVLENKTGTKAVEAIYLRSFKSKVISADADAFFSMSNLRLLKICDVLLPKGLNFLTNELRILKWHGYPLKSLPSSFKPEKLSEFDMPNSCIEQLWKGVVHFENLKMINLSFSQNLRRTPDFKGIPNLERLNLEGCTNLYELHPSVGDLKGLILLNLKHCKELQSLPSIVSGWKSLKVLKIFGCSKLNNLPENLGDSEYLEELDVGQTSVIEAPSSIIHLKNLKRLSFEGCKRPKPWNWLTCFLPDVGPSYTSLILPSLVGLRSLTQLNLSDCNLTEGAIPSDLGLLSGLKTLNLSRNNFISLPAIDQLSKLQTLKLEHCLRLQALPGLPSSIENLCTYNCSSLEMLASPLGLHTSRDREFSMNNCFRLAENQGNNNVALRLLKYHLCMLVKIRLLPFRTFLINRMENQYGCNSVLTYFVRRAIDIMFQDVTDMPSDIPKIVIDLPGDEIPDWFMVQTTHSSINLELPPYWYNDYTILGLAMCALFEVQDTPRISGSKNSYKFTFYLLSDDGNFIIFGKECGFSIDKLTASNHLWLFFLPFDKYLSKKTWPHLKVFFKLEGPGFEFKKCGIRLVRIQDVELINPVLFHSAERSQFQTSIFQGAHSTQLLHQILTFGQTHIANRYNNEAGASGSASVIDETQPNGSASSPDEAMPSGSASSHDKDNGVESSEPFDPLVKLKGKYIQE